MAMVAGSCLGRGTIVRGVFHPTSQLAKFSPPNMPFILNLFRISVRVEAVNYRPFASPSFEVASHVKKLPLLLSVASKHVPPVLN